VEPDLEARIAADVARFERSLRSVRERRSKLDSTRLRLLEKLDRP